MTRKTFESIPQIYSKQITLDSESNILTITGDGISGSGAGLYNITASGISNFTNDVRSQFSAGTNITIAGGVISSTGGGGGGTPGSPVNSVQFNNAGNFGGSSNLTYNNTTNVLSGTTAQFTVITSSFTGSGAGLFGIPNTGLTNSSITVGTTAISLGGSATTIQGITVLTGSTVTGSAAIFTTITGSTVTGSAAIFTTITGTNVFSSNRIGVGTANPASRIDIRGSNTADLYLQSSDTTGIYLSASNTGTGGYTLWLTADGTGAKLRTNSSARDLQLGTNDITALTIDTSQRVGVGTTTPATKLDIYGSSTADLYVHSSDTTAVYISASNTGAGGYALWVTADGTGAKIRTDSSARDLQLGTNFITALTVDTSQRVGIGKTNPSSKLDVNGNASITGTLGVTGNIIVGTAGSGISFGVTANSVSGTMSSELLDDYEEGTWTPRLIGDTTTGSYTATSPVGRYTKIGNAVYITGRVGITTVSVSGTGTPCVGDLPFAVSDNSFSNGRDGAVFFSIFAGVGTNIISLSAYTDNGGTKRPNRMVIRKTTAAGTANSDAAAADIFVGGINTSFSGFYFTDE